MKTIFYIQHYSRKKWRKTFFGTKYENDFFFFDILQDAKKEIDNRHKYETEENFKKLSKYRIIERIYDEIIHEIP